MARYPLTLLPAIAVSAGRAQMPPPAGMLTEPKYGTVAESVAAWVGQGAAWVHVVDADAASGTGANLTLIAEATGAHIQLAGGVRDDVSLRLALATHASRVAIDPDDLDWAARAVSHQGEKVAVALSVRHPDLQSIVTTLDRAGATRYVVHDDVTTGHWRHEGQHLLREFCERTTRPVMAYGGVARLEDLHELHELVPAGLDAIIIGDALYSGAFSYAEAVAAGADRFDMFVWGPPR